MNITMRSDFTTEPVTKSLFYPKDLKLYTENISALVTNSMSDPT